jgi:hypothetical protein
VAKTPSTPASPAVEPDPTPTGKGRATPTRKEREAAQRRPLVPKDRKLASQQNRAALANEREKARIGMAKGDERYLPIRDKGPQKRFVRDFVDARFSAGEILMPTLVLVILTWFVPQIADYAFLGFWASPAGSRRSTARTRSRRCAGTPRCAPSRCGSCVCRSLRSSAAPTRLRRELTSGAPS